MLLLKKIYHHFVPVTVRNKVWSYKIKFINSDTRSLRKKILHYYKNQQNLDVEVTEVINFIRKIGVITFPYQFYFKYNAKDVQVYYDSLIGLSYVLHEGKKLYYKRSFSPMDIKENYNFLCVEQDLASPHRYLTNSFNVKQGDVVVDIGAAEGNFSLSIIEKVSRIYIFEADPEWREALEATFQPWKDKVQIINKYVSNSNNSDCLTIDSFFRKDVSINFFKIDVEGAEAEVLEGARAKLTQNKPIKVAITTYHKQNDNNELAKILSDLNYTISFSKGYMFFLEDKQQPPYLRKALIRAIHSTE